MRAVLFVAGLATTLQLSLQPLLSHLSYSQASVHQCLLSSPSSSSDSHDRHRRICDVTGVLSQTPSLGTPTPKGNLIHYLHPHPTKTEAKRIWKDRFPNAHPCMVDDHSPCQLWLARKNTFIHQFSDLPSWLEAWNVCAGQVPVHPLLAPCHLRSCCYSEAHSRTASRRI